MVNRGIPAFYNPTLDRQTREEAFLLKQRARLIEQLHNLEGMTDKISIVRREFTLRRLKRNEKKLGIKQ